MRLTNESIQAAINKAVEVGFIPSYNAHMKIIRDEMRQILEAALGAENPASEKIINNNSKVIIELTPEDYELLKECVKDGINSSKISQRESDIYDALYIRLFGKDEYADEE
jgi:plasmid stability protein